MGRFVVGFRILVGRIVNEVSFITSWKVDRRVWTQWSIFHNLLESLGKGRSMMVLVLTIFVEILAPVTGNKEGIGEMKEEEGMEWQGFWWDFVHWLDASLMKYPL
jgi:hypothetical protein